MWFEILPSLAIIGVAMAVPHGAAYVMNYLVNGNMYRRSLVTLDEKRQYMRDIRLSGNAYVLKGLENIPDN